MLTVVGSGKMNNRPIFKNFPFCLRRRFLIDTYFFLVSLTYRFETWPANTKMYKKLPPAQRDSPHEYTKFNSPTFSGQHLK